MSSGQLALALADEIAAKHHECMEADQILRDALAKKLNSARECGILLEEAGANLRKSEFQHLVESIALSSDAVKRYRTFANKNPAPVEPADSIRALHELRTVLEATGALPLPNGHGPQIAHGAPPFFAWVAETVMNFKVRYVKYLSARPLDEWRTAEIENFDYSLQPILKIHKQLVEWLRTKT